LHNDRYGPWLGIVSGVGLTALGAAAMRAVEGHHAEPLVRDPYAAAFVKAGAGLRQAVILGAGLDARAFPLDWMPGATVYEIDTSMVLAFKDSVPAGQGAAPRCNRRTVTADLRAIWPTALREAGFDPAATTTWLAEGLFPT